MKVKKLQFFLQKIAFHIDNMNDRNYNIIGMQ